MRRYLPDFSRRPRLRLLLLAGCPIVLLPSLLLAFSLWPEGPARTAPTLTGKDGESVEARGELHSAASSQPGKAKSLSEAEISRLSDRVERLSQRASLREATRDFSEARRLREEVLAETIRLHGKDHWKVTEARLAIEHLSRLKSLNAEQRRLLLSIIDLEEEAKKHSQSRQFQEAAAKLQEALGVADQVWGTKDVEYVRLLRSLGKVHATWSLADRSQLAANLAVWQRLTALERELRGPMHPFHADCLEALAGPHMLSGEYDMAEPLLREAYEIHAHVYGVNHRLSADALYLWAIALAQQGDLQQSADCLEKAIVIYGELGLNTSAIYAERLRRLAEVYLLQGRYQKANEHLDRAADILWKRLGNHPRYASVLIAQATACDFLGEDDRAETLATRAMEIVRPFHTATARLALAMCLQRLALLAAERKDFTRAEELIREAIRMLQQSQGKEHPDCITFQLSLGIIYQDAEKHTEAEHVLKEALALSEKAWGTHSAVYAGVCQELGAFYLTQDDGKEAEWLLLAASTIRQKLPGEARPDHADTLESLTDLYLKQSRLPEAETSIKEALRIREELLGPNHSGLFDTLVLYGNVLDAADRKTELEQLAQRVRKIRKSDPSDDDPSWLR